MNCPYDEQQCEWPKCVTPDHIELNPQCVKANPAGPLQSPEASNFEMELRKEWWTGHGCPFHALYGDDGEMQCSAMR